MSTEDTEMKLVEVLGAQIGFGNMMSLATEAWRQSLLAKGYPVGGEFVVGPCRAMVVSCHDCQRHECDWCCGSGWLTEHVNELKRKEKHENEPSKISV